MKTKTDYEVEGCWCGLKIQTKCRVCGALLIPVPKTGHFNSHYWELQRHNKEQLVCCPNDCAVDVGEKIIKEYLAIRNYCTEESKSWKYELDYTIIKNAWINRRGKVYPIGIREHIIFAYDMNSSESDLEKRGWLKLTSKDLMWEKKLSKRQVDFIFDYLVANNYEAQTKLFMEEYSNSPSRYFKIGKKK